MTSTPRKGTWSVVAAAAFAAMLFGAGVAFSQSFTVGNGQTAGQQTMNNARDTGSVATGGTIQTFNAGENAVQMLGSGQRLTNAGRIGTFGGNAWDVNSQGDDATIINNGLFLAVGDASIGIVSAGSNANIVNNGSIEAVGNNATFGIISDGSGAKVDNRGFIGVSGTASVAIIGDKSDLTVSNSGAIEAEGFAASGILWGSVGPLNDGLRLTNSGSITVSGDASTAIGAGGNDIAITNTGDVYASGTSSTGILTLFGNAAITNSGSVIVSGANSVSIAATGPSSVITNSGRVFNDQSAAIFFGSSDATLNLLGGTAIQGPIVFSGSGNTVSFGPGLNAVMSFSGSGLPQTILTGGRPFVASGGTIAVVDITGFASSAPLVEDLVDGIGSVAEARMFAPQADMLAPRNGPDAWLATFGGIRSQAGSGPFAGFSQALGGVVAGAERHSGDGFLGGVFVGGAAGSTEVDDDAQEVTHRSVFAGAYLDYDGGAHFAGVTFIAGVLDELSRRRVANNLVLGGVETARADFNGIFVSPAVTFGTRLPVAAGTLIPSMRLRYTGLFVDDYTETGSDDDLAVSRRDVHLFEMRGQLALALAPVRKQGQTWQTTLRAGIDALAQNSEDVSATLLGQDISFAAGGRKTVLRGFAGADLTADVGAGMTLDAGFEAGYGSDNAFTVRGQARLSKAF
ncbi:autotransporter outer membrane beta-barrel domain-containing protein [Mesorhizobium sp. 131-2-1]|uniref:autotransporter outer membrane beta-barrel domain-containing protein n=1 Tax=Mesorhizobium sp. 131-2-1 TaxID=2744518 RepID=UPI001926750D|nr:autotransporter outer membrane beta-barrel domain-containing protein [Mesorhizobium sp. 131-2-1]BCG93275.1 hypothetical protein MesoLj131a_21390 [Mesorhizobium sp. 131-2-1]